MKIYQQKKNMKIILKNPLEKDQDYSLIQSHQ